MAIKVKYLRTELSEGEEVVYDNVDLFYIHDDNTVELRQRTTPGKYRVVGYIHPNQWQAILQVEAAE